MMHLETERLLIPASKKAMQKASSSWVLTQECYIVTVSSALKVDLRPNIFLILNQPYPTEAITTSS